MRFGQYFCILFALITALFALPASAQQTAPGIRGQVTDDTGSAIPGATVTVTGPGGRRTASTNEQGAFSAPAAAAGNYTVTVAHPGFANYTVQVPVLAGRGANLTIAMKLETSKQEVTVQGEAVGVVNTDPTQNAGALVLRQDEIDALPDDPDDLASDLQALAGPSAGPNGGQIFIDGFTGGQLPPKESIREIRINQNPFSAEYDHLGFGRVEILTRPGTDKLRGQIFLNDSDRVFDARNPYTFTNPDFSSRQYGGNISGPINKKASFFVDFDRRDINDASVSNGRQLDAGYNVVPFGFATQQPQTRTMLSPRLDYAINPNSTLVVRYSYFDNQQNNAGLGTFDLASRAYRSDTRENNLQVTETAVLNSKVINETRFRWEHTVSNQTANSSAPALVVSSAFNGGGAGVGRSMDTNNNLELQNYTSVVHGAQAIKFGVRLRSDLVANNSPQNFNGTYIFAGGLAPELDAAGIAIPNSSIQINSLEQYRRALLQLPGGAPSQFTLSGGNPKASINYLDAGLFFQDDWRLKPNFTLSLGLRYETQTQIGDHGDIAPRIGFAWSPDSKGSKPGRTVIRGGAGIFYDRFPYSLALNALRYNGITEQRYIVNNPSFFSLTSVPTIAQLNAQAVQQTVQQVDKNLHAPYIIQSVIGVERQLPKNTTVAVNYTRSHGVHEFDSRNINAPLPGTYVAGVRGSGVFPYGNIGNIYNYESNGLLNQNQLIVNVNSRMNRSFTLFSFYVLNFARSTSDGSGSFPADQYNLGAEYGRSAFDTRHRMVLGGSYVSRWNLRWSPFLIARSGSPYNITTGNDLNGDSVFTDRPALVPGCVTLAASCFVANPAAGTALIPRNFATGPANYSLNLRVSKTFGFGPEKSTGGSGGGMGGPMGGPMGMGGPHGGPRGGGGMFGDPGTSRRYNLTLSASARNLLNTNNPGQPIGVLTSPLFGQSNSLAGGFGPGGTSVTNRRIELGARFSF